jgi:hypothetical protein
MAADASRDAPPHRHAPPLPGNYIIASEIDRESLACAVVRHTASSAAERELPTRRAHNLSRTLTCSGACHVMLPRVYTQV